MRKGKKATKEIWKYFLFLLDSIFCLLIKTSAITQRKNGLKNILLIRVDGIGDSILWLDSQNGLMKVYPPDSYQYTLVCNKYSYSIFKSFEIFDKIDAIDKNSFYTNLRYRFKTLRSICSVRYDIIVQPTYSREFAVGDSIVRLAKSPVKIGSAGDRSNSTILQKNISDNWYTKLVPASDSVLMELERNAEFIRGLGLDGFMASVPVLPNCASAVEIPKKPYFVVFPGSITIRKMWPAERFSEIARKVYQKKGWLTVICGSNGELEACGRIYSSLKDIPVLNLAGKTSIESLSEVIREAELLISNDTGSIHIAAAVSTPSVCILGGGHLGRFLPYSINGRFPENAPVCVIHPMDCFNCSWQCIHTIRGNDPFPCIQNILVDEVWEKVSGVLIERAGD
jgi:ADP-heptose:LPS heptosyltransferase